MGDSRDPESLPYTRHTLTADDEGAVLDALRSGCIAQGPITSDFESRLARRVGVDHAVAVASGTTALEIALAAMGVGPGHEVVVPPLTFVATANAVLACGARPVFADVEPDTLNLSPSAVEAKLSDRCVGAIPVHYAGHPADMEALRDVVGPDRFLLEDAAHALGATAGGKAAGSLGDASCFSFHPAKLITSGEGGAVLTTSSRLDQELRTLREHGLVRDPNRFTGLGFPKEEEDALGPWVYEQQRLGGNARLPEVGAALARSQLTRVDQLLDRRRQLACAYDEALADLDAIERPIERAGIRSAWHLYPIRLRPDRSGISRRTLFERLHTEGIRVQVHYIPVHLQPYYRRHFGTRHGDCPVAEEAYLRLLSLPLFPDMTETHTYRVVDALRRALGEAER